MSTFRILLAEIGYRKLNFVLSVAAVAVASTLFVTGPILVDGYARESAAELAGLQQRADESAQRLLAAEKEAAAEMARLEDDTRKLMRDLGFNLILVHRDEDAVKFLADGLPTLDMPQEFVHRLATDTRLTFVTHLVATLRGAAPFDGRTVRIAGYLPEVRQKHMQHETPMGYTVEVGTVVLGYRLAGERKPGDAVELGGRSFRIANILAEQGNEDDGSIVMNLADAQTLLDKPEKINVILALECRCTENALPRIRKQLATVLPETQVLRDLSKAEARAKQRAAVKQKYEQLVASHAANLRERQSALEDTAARRAHMQGLMETLAGTLTPLVVIAAAAWVGLMAWVNVRERRAEIGILRAIGKPSRTIAALVLGKAVLVGAAGAVVGAAVGFALARWLSVNVFELSTSYVAAPRESLIGVLLGAPLLAAVASYLPALVALSQDPAAVLRDA